MSRHPQGPGGVANATAKEIPFVSSDGQTLESSADLTFDDAGNRLAVGMSQAQLPTNASLGVKSPASAAGSFESIACFTKSDAIGSGAMIMAKANSTRFAADFRTSTANVDARLSALTSASNYLDNVIANADGSTSITGARRVPQSLKTTAYPIVDTDDTIWADATAGAFDVTLPAASATRAGQTHTVKRMNGGGNAVTVKSAGGTIDGVAAATGIALSAQFQARTYRCDGTNWNIVGGYL